VLDLTLAIAHHLLIFALFGALTAELLLAKPGMDEAQVRRLARIDGAYGLTAMLVVVVGFSRAVFAAKGWDYYLHNGFFWAKVATFAVIGLLSIPPTIFWLKARRAGGAPAAADIARIRKFLHAQSGLFPLLLVFAAAMARGYGQF
jgi:putative membrane protein